MNRSAAKKEYKRQKEFAQNQIQWKVSDAKAAGIHPLYALGASTVNYSPVSTGDYASGLASAGQDIGRAIDATASPTEKVDAYTEALRKLQLRRGELENTLLASKIAQINQAGQPPGVEDLKNPQRTRGIYLHPGLGVPSYGSSDAQVVQDRYGDVMEEIYGLRNWYYDHRPALRRKIFPTPAELFRR